MYREYRDTFTVVVFDAAAYGTMNLFRKAHVNDMVDLFLRVSIKQTHLNVRLYIFLPTWTVFQCVPCLRHPCLPVEPIVQNLAKYSTNSQYFSLSLFLLYLLRFAIYIYKPMLSIDSLCPFEWATSICVYIAYTFTKYLKLCIVIFKYLY